MTKKTATILYIVGWSLAFLDLTLMWIRLLPVFGTGILFVASVAILGVVTIWQGVIAIQNHRTGLGVALILVGSFFGWAYLSVFDKNENTHENVSPAIEPNIESEIVKNKEAELLKLKKIREAELAEMDRQLESDPADK